MFLIRPRPFIDESLSSWRQRAGMDNGFSHFPQPARKYWSTDPDRKPSMDEIDWLIDEFRIDESSVACLTLEHCSPLFSGKATKATKFRWILPLGSNGHQTLSGSLYCPNCLQEDAIPYFRLAWRFAFLCHCPKHGTKLLDRCPSCNETIWPSHHRHTLPQWLSLRYCRSCGHDLADCQKGANVADQLSSDLWQCATSGRIPSGAKQADNPTTYFDGLWSFCQLLIRRQSAHIGSFLPREIRFSLPIFPQTISTIEQLPASVRHLVVTGAAWLLEDWPNRFIDTAKQCAITGVHLSPTRPIHPVWLDEVVNQHLTVRKHNAFNMNQLCTAISKVQSSSSIVTKIAVRRALGISESTLLNTILYQRRHATKDEFHAMSQRFELALTALPDKRAQHTSLVRDYVIFLLSALYAMSCERVCNMSKTDVQLHLSDTRLHRNDDTEWRTLFLRMQVLNEIYGSQIRPTFLRDSKTKTWFVSRFGECLKAHSVRARITKMLNTGFNAKLWRSADVFIYSLRTAPVGRRPCPH